MHRQQINRVSGIVPIVMSLAALLLVLVGSVMGWEKGQTDEGAAAHIFQLLVVAQLPIVLLFLVTADWKRIMPIARPLALQAVALVLAVGTAYYLT